MFLVQFLKSKDGKVYPEFPTGNGQIDLLIDYKGRLYGIELKSFSDEVSYKKALQQAAGYAQKLELKTIHLVFFIDSIDEENRRIYEVEFHDTSGEVTVSPIFVATHETITLPVNNR